MENGSLDYLGYAFAFLTYIITYFIINFYAVALAANMLDIFDGNKKSYQEYVRFTRGKIGTILIFSIISASVGMFLQYVVERIKFVGWIISWLLGTAWSLGTMFVLPIIAREEVGAPTAIKRSIGFFKQTWGENIVAKITVNLPLALINIAMLFVFGLLAVGAVMLESWPLLILLFVLFIIASLTLSIIGSFANSLINTALYYYAANQRIPAAFSEDMLNSIFIPRTKRRFFGRSKA